LQLLLIQSTVSSFRYAGTFTFARQRRLFSLPTPCHALYFALHVRVDVPCTAVCPAPSSRRKADSAPCWQQLSGRIRGRCARQLKAIGSIPRQSGPKRCCGQLAPCSPSFSPAI